MKKIYLFLLLTVCWQISAQTSLTIPQIQGADNASAYSGTRVKTSGIVTAKYIGSGMINGFFLQDAAGDGNPNTSDGIFVATATDNVTVGDKIELTATVDEYNGRTQLINPTATVALTKNNPLPVSKIVFDPATFPWEKYEGMLLEFDQTLWVNNNYNLFRYGELELGVKRKPSPTNVVFPSVDNNSEFRALVSQNSLPSVYMDNAYTTNYIAPAVFADANGTRRTGERVKNLQAVVDYANGKYVVYPIAFPVNFYGNPRPEQPADLGNYNIKVCGFNLEYYLTVPNSSSMGPSSQDEMARQHTKIVQALKAIDADVYGLVEIEQGQAALTKLATSLTLATGKTYAFINDGGSINGTYTKVGYLYCSDRVTPYSGLKNNNSAGPVNRKKLQAFTLKSNNEKFIFSINHFKAKSGCGTATGDDADKYDGQSCFNATRVAEANSTINFINTNKGYYADDDALVMGDLNAYAKEDPIQEFVKGGYVDLHRQFHPDTAYSYVYRAEAGYLDHALANESMAKQITGASVFHINADELADFEYSGSKYQPNMYRCSDHDPVVVGIALGEMANIDLLPFNERVKIFPTLVRDFFTVKNAESAYIQVFALNGVKLYQDKITQPEQSFDVKNLGLIPGAYIIRVLGENSIVHQIIVVK